MSHRCCPPIALTPRLASSALLLLLTALGCPVQGGAADLTFAVFGDCRPAGAAPYSPVLHRLARDMATQQPAFVLGTGDYIGGSSDETTLRRQWQGFFLGIAPLQGRGKVPVALAPGNHDILGSRRNQRIFDDYFDGLHYSFSRGPYHFVILDTEEPGREGRIASKQLAWLKADLAASRAATLTFVALHRPLFPVDGHIGSSLDEYPTERDALHALFIKEGVDCVFMGHEHLYNRHQRDGVDYVITGGAGAPLYAKPDKGGFYHYILAFITGAGYTLRVRKTEGPSPPLSRAP